jgi:uncharacterized protein (UPF0264 family)
VGLRARPKEVVNVKLLVSVVDEAEARAAVAGGADIVDVKNPREGSLGANFPGVIRAVRQLLPPPHLVSATLGDVPNLPGTVSLAALGAAVCGVDFVKLGLFGVTDTDAAHFLLARVGEAVKSWNPAIQVIAAGYADAWRVGAIAPLGVPAVARAAGLDGCMIDTIGKGQGSLFTYLNESQLSEFVAACRANGLLCGLAGSLAGADLPRVQALGADVVGVRSAACQGDRVAGRIDPERVRWLKSLVSSGSESPASPPALVAPPVVPGVTH